MPHHKHQILPEKIIRHLLGEDSEAEKKEMAEWLESDPGNRKLYADYKWIWEESRQLSLSSEADPGTAWEKFQDKIKTVPIARKNRQWIWKAASVLILTGTAVVYFSGGGSSIDRESVVATASPITDTLPDGSVVTLNKHSAINYSAGEQRSVDLVGEAFFDVSPNKKKKFVISVNGVTVEVTGTSFNVKGSRDHTEVIVETGVVIVRKAGYEVELHPDEKISIRNDDSVLRKDSVSGQLHNYYRTREFVCDNTPLWKLIEVLNEAYGTTIILRDPKIGSYPLTTTFENEDIDNILLVISQTFKLQVERSGKYIYLQ